MQNNAKLIRIETAFDEPEMVRTPFERNAPYRTIVEYIPRGPEQPVLPYFRGNWAVGGEPLVGGAEMILRNHRFIDAAGKLFGTPRVRPSLIVVNVNGPMPAGPTYVDASDFHGATRELYPHRFPVAMGRRVIRAGAVSWFLRWNRRLL